MILFLAGRGERRPSGAKDQLPRLRDDELLSGSEYCPMQESYRTKIRSLERQAMGKALWSAFVVLSLRICLAIAVMAQSDTARLQGTVTDPQGGAVNGATVTVTSTETARVTTATTNDLGYYTVSALPPGYYRVEVKHKDFKTISRVLELQIAQVGAADFQLQLDAASEPITLEAGSPVINTQHSSISDVVDHRQISELPLNGRNFTQLATLVPGASRGIPTGANSATGVNNNAETFRFVQQ